MKDLYGLKITNFRYGIVYGPKEWYGRVLTIFLKSALKNKPIIIFGNGNQVRDFVFVKDVVDMNIRCFENDKSSDEIFNVSTGIGTTINDLAKDIQKVVNKKLQIIHENIKEGAKSKYSNRIRLPMELKKLIQSPKKAKKIVNWEPTTQLQDGLLEEWNWLNENPHRWKKMNY